MGDWRNKLLNGLDDIGIALQYEDLIAAYEKNREARLLAIKVYSEIFKKIYWSFLEFW